MDRGAWWAVVHGVTKSWAWLSNKPPPPPMPFYSFLKCVVFNIFLFLLVLLKLFPIYFKLLVCQQMSPQAIIFLIEKVFSLLVLRYPVSIELVLWTRGNFEIEESFNLIFCHKTMCKYFSLSIFTDIESLLLFGHLYLITIFHNIKLTKLS